MTTLDVHERSLGEFTVKGKDLEIILRRYPSTASGEAAPQLNAREEFALYVWQLPFHRAGQEMLVEALKIITKRALMVVTVEARNGYGEVIVQYLDGETC